MILPGPASPFEWRYVAGLPALVCPPLEETAPHLFTTRQWQIGALVAQGSDRAGWHEVASALDVEESNLVRVRQVHGADVAVVRAGAATPADADIIVSAEPSCALAIRVADCVPLLLADRRTGAVAAAHAGWRGLAAGVPAIAVRALLEESSGRLSDVLVAAGPSIGACCYEVKDDVFDAFAARGFGRESLQGWFLRAPHVSSANPPMREIANGQVEGRWFFDGWACLRDQLVAAGLDSTQVFLADTCTASHPGAFCSYRRDGAPAGRLVGAIRSASRA